MSKVRIGLIYASNRECHFCEQIANWVTTEIEHQGIFLLDLIDVKSTQLPTPGDEDSESLRQLRNQLESADAFVLITTEYTHDYPAALKLLIDRGSREWHAKPVAFVSCGGISDGMRAVKKLRQVFAELHAVTLRDTLSFANPHAQLNHQGQPQDDTSARRRLSRMLAYLDWWAIALRQSRRLSPYQEIME